MEGNQRKDIIERQSKEEDSEEYDGSELSEFVKNINKLLKATEVCGQILRNRVGSLERHSLELIYEEALIVLLKLLNLVLKTSELLKEEAVRMIRKTLDISPDMSDEKITRLVKRAFLDLNYSIILGVLNRASFSLGSARCREIYIKVTEDKVTPAARLVQEIIELQFEKKLDIKKIKLLHNEFSQNPICDHVLKYVILRHCYMHDIGYKYRQQLASTLDIPMQVQRKLAIASKQ